MNLFSYSHITEIKKSAGVLTFMVGFLN